MQYKNAFKRLVALFAVTVSLASAAPAYALSGIYIYANGGGYYTQYGPVGYWYTASNQGYCGHISAGCSPSEMKWTYGSECIGSVNYAQWNNIDSYQNGVHKVFIPAVNATSGMAPYEVIYNGISQDAFTINQNAYYDQWILTDTYYDIRTTWLRDNPCEGTPYKKIGFDEIQIGY